MNLTEMAESIMSVLDNLAETGCATHDHRIVFLQSIIRPLLPEPQPPPEPTPPDDHL